MLLRDLDSGRGYLEALVGLDERNARNRLDERHASRVQPVLLLENGVGVVPCEEHDVIGRGLPQSFGRIDRDVRSRSIQSLLVGRIVYDVF